MSTHKIFRLSLFENIKFKQPSDAIKSVQNRHMKSNLKRRKKNNTFFQHRDVQKSFDTNAKNKEKQALSSNKKVESESATFSTLRMHRSTKKRTVRTCKLPPCAKWKNSQDEPFVSRKKNVRKNLINEKPCTEEC